MPRLMTMSISSAPSLTANRVSASFTLVGACPLGKAVATEATFTPLSPKAFFATFTREGYTQMAATVGSPGSWSCR